MSRCPTACSLLHDRAPPDLLVVVCKGVGITAGVNLQDTGGEFCKQHFCNIQQNTVPVRRHAQRLLKYGFVLGPQFDSNSNLPPDDADSVPATVRRNAPSNVILNIADLRNTMNEAAAEAEDEEEDQGVQQQRHDGLGLKPSAAVTGGQNPVASHRTGHVDADYSRHNQGAVDSQPGYYQAAGRNQLGARHPEDVHNSSVQHTGAMGLDMPAGDPQQQTRLQRARSDDPGLVGSEEIQLQQTHSSLGQETDYQQHSQHPFNDREVHSVPALGTGSDTSVLAQDISVQGQGMAPTGLQGNDRHALGLSSVLRHQNPTERQMHQLGERFARQVSAVRGSRTRVHLASVRFAEEPDQTT